VTNVNSPQITELHMKNTARRSISSRTATTQYAIMAMIAEPGIVKTHAHTTRRAMFQLTGRHAVGGPTPMIAPVMVWVVLTGMPANERRTASPQQRSRRTHAHRLQPRQLCAHRAHDTPAAEHGAKRNRAVARQHDPQRHGFGIINTLASSLFAPTSNAVMMPIVFWASLAP
jgi:hypothetical protein